MKKKLNLDLLNKQKLSTLEIIKSEAEINLDEISKSEDIITNKSNSLFQILLVAFTSIFTYLATNFQNNILVHLSLIFLFFIGYSIILLKKIIYPDKIKLKGSMPNKLVQKDILFYEKEELDNERLLRNRIFSLDIAIQKNILSLNNRVHLYRKSNESLFLGLILIIFYTIIYFVINPS